MGYICTHLYLNGEKERLIELVGLALEKKGELKRK